MEHVHSTILGTHSTAGIASRYHPNQHFRSLSASVHNPRSCPQIQLSMSWALASLRYPGSSRRVLMAALASTFKRFESCSMHPIHGWQSETATRSPLPLLRQHPRCALRTSGTWLRSGVPVRHPLRAHHPRSGCGASTLTPVYRACARRARKPHLDAVR